VAGHNEERQARRGDFKRFALGCLKFESVTSNAPDSVGRTRRFCAEQVRMLPSSTLAGPDVRISRIRFFT
jgi:hypothetical protein